MPRDGGCRWGLQLLVATDLLEANSRELLDWASTPTVQVLREGHTCCFVAEPRAESGKRPGVQLVREVDLVPSKLTSQKSGSDRRHGRTREIRVLEEDFERCGSDLQRLRRCTPPQSDAPLKGARSFSMGSPFPRLGCHRGAPAGVGLAQRPSTTACSEGSNTVAGASPPQRPAGMPPKSPSAPALVGLSSKARGCAKAGRAAERRPPKVLTWGNSRMALPLPPLAGAQQRKAVDLGIIAALGTRRPQLRVQGLL